MHDFIGGETMVLLTALALLACILYAVAADVAGVESVLSRVRVSVREPARPGPRASVTPERSRVSSPVSKDRRDRFDRVSR
jgi:hypothetical protein